MYAYSLDLRTCILADTDRGLSTRVVATKYAVSASWVRRLKQRRRETGEIAPRIPTPGPMPSWGAYADPPSGRCRGHPGRHPGGAARSAGADRRPLDAVASGRRARPERDKKSSAPRSRTGRT